MRKLTRRALDDASAFLTLLALKWVNRHDPLPWRATLGAEETCLHCGKPVRRDPEGIWRHLGAVARFLRKRRRT